MSVFFKSLLCAAIAGGLSAAVVGKAYEKHIRYLSALLCTALMVSPFLKLIPQLDIRDYKQETEAVVDKQAAEKLVSAQRTEDMENTVADYIFSQTGIKAGGISIQIESKEGTLTVEKVSVTVAEISDIEPVKGCLAKLFENTVPIEVEWNG